MLKQPSYGISFKGLILPLCFYQLMLKKYSCKTIQLSALSRIGNDGRLTMVKRLEDSFVVEKIRETKGKILAVPQK